MKDREALYQAVVENMRGAYAFCEILKDSSGRAVDYRFLEVNASFARAVPLAREDIIGNTASNILPGIQNDSIDWIGIYDRLAQAGNGTVTEFEGFSQLLDRWFSVWAISPQKGYFALIFNEISHLKQVQNEASLAHKIIESSPNVLFKWRAEARRPVDYVTENVSQFGYRSAEFLEGKIHFVDIIHPDDLERVREEVRKHVDAGIDRFKQKYRVFDKDGHVRWIDDWTIVVRDEHGKITHHHGIIADITESVLAENNLKKNEETFRNIIENMQDVYYRGDLEGNLVMASPSALKLLGYDNLEEILGKNIAQTFYANPEQRHELLGILQEHGEVTNYEVPLRRKDGKVITVITSSHFCYDKQGNLDGIEGIFSDITERKKSEEELLRAKQETERMALEAQIANRAKSEFLANMSHEIRTPMNGVLGMSGLLLDTDLTPEQQEYTEAIRGSAESLLDIINSILDFSKIESGKLELEGVEFLLRPTLDEMIDLLSLRAQEKKVVLVSRVDPGIPPMLRGDMGRIRQVLTNLMDNAIKFSPGGNVTLQVSMVKQENKNVLLKFEVKDNGIGIAPDKLETLFDPFVQADTSTTRKFGGTGLGLAISKQLCELMGGKIGVESQVGEGALFWITVPLEVVAMESIETPSVTETQTAAVVIESPEAVRGGRILLVEDNAINQKLALRLLSKMGYRADIAANGLEALLALKNIPYDLVLMDIQMPVMDGMEASTEIRKSERGKPGVPIIAITASAMKGDREKCLQAGMNDYISKPIQATRLARVVNRWIGKKV